MIDDIKQFYKFYKLYKKGKREMDKAKEWIDSHKIELTVACTAMLFYRIGFRRGAAATDRAVCKLLYGLESIAAKVNMGGK